MKRPHLEADLDAMRQEGIDAGGPPNPRPKPKPMFLSPDLLVTHIDKIPTILEAFEKLLIRAATQQKTGNVRMMVKFKNGCPKTYQEAEDFPTVTDHDLTGNPELP